MTSITSSPPPANEKPQKTVRFDRLYIQTYKYMLGDNPAVNYGPPISSEWEPIEKKDGPITETSTQFQEIYTVQEYERIRPRRLVTYKRPGHRGPSWIYLTLSQVKREELLKRLGVDKKEIRDAIKEVNRIQRNRWLSLKWYFHPGRTVTELPHNFYGFFRSYQLERQRMRFIKNYHKKSKATNKGS